MAAMWRQGAERAHPHHVKVALIFVERVERFYFHMSHVVMSIENILSD